MKIHNIKINGYGNIKDKDIDLNNKINIIYGKNESGKSTAFKFILNMLYGASRNKKGRDISDFDRYKPWYTEEFSGKMEYSLDNGEIYNIYREFKKKSPIIYNKNGEDISHKYILDKNNGNQFFYEQTNIDEELFLSSTAVMQQEVEINGQSKGNIIQKLSNLAGSGNDNISYKKCIDKLNKRQLTEIGTERSQDRPINKINNLLEVLKNDKKELSIFQDEKYIIEENIEKIKEEIQKKEIEINSLKEVVKLKQKIDLEEEKIKINEEINEKNKLEIKEIEEQKKIKEEELSEFRKNKNKKIDKKIYWIILIILILINTLSIILLKTNFKFLSLISLIIWIVAYIFNVYNKEKKIKLENKKELDKRKDEINKINSQLEILIKNAEHVDKEIEEIKNKINQENINKEQVKNSQEQLDEKIDIFNNLKIKLHSIELDKNNIYPKLDNLANIEEKIESLEEELEYLEEKNRSIELAKEVLENAYKIMRENITPKFSENLSKIINNISNGKYSKIRINEENNIIVELENGKYIPIELLSTGTIDQLYLAFRIAIIKEITGENLPIILDESFAYYDDNRLKNMIEYISKNIENQIIIFTCTEREKVILDELNIKYNHINLSNDL